jgi:hypothetical protein
MYGNKLEESKDKQRILTCFKYSSVGIVTGYGPDNWSSIPGRGKNIFRHHVQTGSEAH